MEQQLDENCFDFYEGSEVIASLVPGGLDAFHRLQESEKLPYRNKAIEMIAKQSSDKGKVTIVTGHFMFWSKDKEAGQSVFTERDGDTYTHILYLDVPSLELERRQLHDTTRKRPSVSVSHLQKWQEEEQRQLRPLCQREGIFYFRSQIPSPADRIAAFLQDFRIHSEKYNLVKATRKLDDAVYLGQDLLKTMLVLDGDKTLAATDTNISSWKFLTNSQQKIKGTEVLRDILSGPSGYSYKAFRQATLLYEELATDQEFEHACQTIAANVIMYPEFVCLLKMVAAQCHVGAVVITAGLRRVWELVLEREGFSTIKVIGGGRISDGFVVHTDLKAALVTHLREHHRLSVWAFGDSPLDIGMLEKANRAIVIVGGKEARSATMEETLRQAVSQGLVAHQVLLPDNVAPRLNTNQLPTIKLTGPTFVRDLLGDLVMPSNPQVLCATDKPAARLLATPMRDSAIFGPALRAAHRRAGAYLATEYLSEIIGLEKCPITHVLGRETRGYQLFHERDTLVVALMRGGEPMAAGVSDTFPLAMFLHAKDADDIKDFHLSGMVTVILVDSVINAGKTIVDCVRRVRDLHATIRIVIVAGVVQAECVNGEKLTLPIAGIPQLQLVALRLSETKFVGSRETDTGNRLFNTTHLD